MVSIRARALAFGRMPIFRGEENSTAWLANTARAARLFGYPTVSLDQMTEWLSRDMMSLGKEFAPGRTEEREWRCY
jgi:hypothetical protein